MTPGALGKVTVLWWLCLTGLLGYSAGSFWTYVLSLYFRETGRPAGFESVYPSLFVQDTDDLAGLLCYVLAGLIFVPLAALLCWKSRATLKLPCPKLKPVLRSAGRAALVTLPVWGLFGWFFEYHRSELPGDGNWPAIGCVAFTGALFLVFFAWLLPETPGRSSRAA